MELRNAAATEDVGGRHRGEDTESGVNAFWSVNPKATGQRGQTLVMIRMRKRHHVGLSGPSGRDVNGDRAKNPAKGASVRAGARGFHFNGRGGRIGDHAVIDHENHNSHK